MLSLNIFRCGDPSKPKTAPSGRKRAGRWPDRFRPQFEALEDRIVLSNIIWWNRGILDGFGSVFGNEAEQAREVVDAAIDFWERVITNFNHPWSGPGDEGTLVVGISMGGEGDRAGSAEILEHREGFPVFGQIDIPARNDFFLDDDPYDWSEFGTVVNAFAGNAPAGSEAFGKADLFTIVAHELTHLLGISANPSLKLSTSGLAVNTQIADGPGAFWAFDGENIRHLLTSVNVTPSGSEDAGGPVHSADPGARICQQSQGGFAKPAIINGEPTCGDGHMYEAAVDIVNARSVTADRAIVPNTIARVLQDAYGYSIVEPETFGTFYAILDEKTGELLIRGKHSIVDVLSDDVITISQVGSELVVSVDIGEDVPGTGPTDAFVSRFDLNQVKSIRIEAGFGDDTINLGDPLAESPTPIGAGVGSGGASAGIPVSVDGGGGIDTLNVYDQAVWTGPYTITGTEVDRPGLGRITTLVHPIRGGIENRVIHTNSDVINVHNLSANTSLTLLAGNRPNQINLARIFANSQVTINAGSGGDELNVELPTIQGDLSIDGGTGSDILMVNAESDSAALGPYTYRVTGTRVSRDNSPVAQTDYTGIEDIRLTTGEADDTIYVHSTPHSTPFSGPAGTPVHVQTGMGDDTIFVGADGVLDEIRGPVSVDGGGFPGEDTLIVNDTDYTSAETYTVRWNRVERGSKWISYAATANIELYAGRRDDTINVRSTAADTRVTVNAGLGHDSINIGDEADTLAPILGDVIVNGDGHRLGNVIVPQGTDVLRMNDQGGFLVPQSYVIVENAVVLGSSEIQFSTVEVVEVNGGHGGLQGNTFAVWATAPGVRLTVNAGAASDTISVGNPFNGLDEIQGDLVINGQTNWAISDDRLILRDVHAFGAGSGKSYTFTSTAIAWFGVRRITYGTIESLELVADGGHDTITVESTAAGLRSLMLNAGSGADSVVLKSTSPNTATTVNAGDGDDAIDIAAAGSGADLDLVAGAVTVNGQAGSDSITLHDESHTGGQTYDIANTTVTRTGGFGGLMYFSIDALTVNAGPGEDTINITSTAVGTPVHVNAGPGVDTVDGTTSTVVITAFGEDGDDTLYGGAANDILFGGWGYDILDGGPGDNIIVELLGTDVVPDGTVYTCTVSNTLDQGAGALRPALACANQAPGLAVVDFQLLDTDPGFVDVDSGLAGGDADHDAFVISPVSPLPDVNNPSARVIVNGHSQTNYGGDTNAFGPEIVLDGAAAGADASGLRLLSGDNQVLGLNIQGFLGHGIEITGASGNVVQGNFIGTDATGTQSFGNGQNGVLIAGGAADTVLGGLTDTPGAAPGNVISGNGGNGVWIKDRGSDDALIQGNLIGLGADGTTSLGNTGTGVFINNPALGARIGGDSDPRSRNVISANQWGVRLSASGSNLGTLIQGNYIGTDITGALDRGNRATGVTVGSAPGTQVGGAAVGAGNVISGNRTGVFIHAISHPVIDGKYNSVVQGNIIGLNAAGTAALGNDTGVIIRNADNLIGGATAAAGNVISGNQSNGVRIFEFGAPSPGNTIRGNSIFDNGALGIDLVGGVEDAFGVTENDRCDGDIGPNSLQNYPQLNSATFRERTLTTRVKGRLNSQPGAPFILDFYASPAADADPSGFGEGQRWLGSLGSPEAPLFTNDNCRIGFTITLPVVTSPGEEVISATATLLVDHDTDPATPPVPGDTSEFSAFVAVKGPRPRIGLTSEFVMPNTSDSFSTTTIAPTQQSGENPLRAAAGAERRDEFELPPNSMSSRRWIHEVANSRRAPSLWAETVDHALADFDADWRFDGDIPGLPKPWPNNQAMQHFHQ